MGGRKVYVVKDDCVAPPAMVSGVPGAVLDLTGRGATPPAPSQRKGVVQ